MTAPTGTSPRAGPGIAASANASRIAGSKDAR
jgi:hypothetical protein